MARKKLKDRHAIILSGLATIAGIALVSSGINYVVDGVRSRGSASQEESVIDPAYREVMESIRNPLAHGEQGREAYEGFTYRDEIPMILRHANRVGVEPELLMAIRDAEDGSDHVAYGILPMGSARERYDNDEGYILNGEFNSYSSEVEKQLCWATWTVRRNRERFFQDPENHADFISYLADVYAPIDADNDPNSLNRNWERNVRDLYNEFSGN